MKDFYRSADDQMLLGLCGGIAHKYELDPFIVRLITVFLLLATPIMFWVYIIMSIWAKELPTKKEK